MGHVDLDINHKSDRLAAAGGGDAPGRLEHASGTRMQREHNPVRTSLKKASF
ncbi:hypothetical protein JYU34_012343 [Plutella xylostella]|uniref:Uncharacterized protein n=1 Tax=Plutella xylostella TaxID=51655 RepID=A0ABQ7QEW4_PLUXY|nr:hypothetical protein JYU34_012343 [Plutella xylostella]